MISQQLKKFKIILASGSPRRQFLLRELGLNFEVRIKENDESFPKNLKGKQITLYLCKKKAKAFKHELKQNDLLITADTIVWFNNRALNKPSGYAEAANMLKTLSGKMHVVYTGVCITTINKTKSFCASTKVYFKKLSNKEIDFYVKHYKPYDKAGAYGAQECLPAEVNPCSKNEIKFLRQINNPGLFTISNSTKAQVGQIEIVKKIIGSYFNVMGLPVKELYEELMKL